MGELSPMQHLKDRVRSFDDEVLRKSKAFTHVQESQADRIKRMRKALEVLENVEGLRQVHDQEIATLRAAGEAIYPKVVEQNLQLFVELAQELVNETWALAMGFPKSTVCVCPRCKRIVLPEPGGLYRHCNQLWDDFGRRKEIAGITPFFWNSHKPGDKYRGLTGTDDQEDLLKKGSA